MDVVWIYKPPLGRCLEYNSFSLCESTLTVDIMLLRSPARIAFTCPLPAYFNTWRLGHVPREFLRICTRRSANYSSISLVQQSSLHGRPTSTTAHPQHPHSSNRNLHRFPHRLNPCNHPLTLP